MFHNFFIYLFFFSLSWIHPIKKSKNFTMEEGNKKCAGTDLVYSSCSWPGSGGKNFTASLNIVFAGPAKYWTVGHYHWVRTFIWEYLGSLTSDLFHNRFCGLKPDLKGRKKDLVFNDFFFNLFITTIVYCQLFIRRLCVEMLQIQWDSNGKRNGLRVKTCF